MLDNEQAEFKENDNGRRETGRQESRIGLWHGAAMKQCSECDNFGTPCVACESLANMSVLESDAYLLQLDREMQGHTYGPHNRREEHTSTDSQADGEAEA